MAAEGDRGGAGRQQWIGQPVPEALKPRVEAGPGGRPGRTAAPESTRPTHRLTQEQRAELPRLLERGPEAYGFRGALWTEGRIAQVIRQSFGVSYHPAHVGRILKACGWSLQKPVRRATQRDEQAIRTWREERWPQVKKRPNRRSAPSSS
jgi:transposase